jgi:hypothetical protein
MIVVRKNLVGVGFWAGSIKNTLGSRPLEEPICTI